MLHSMWDLSSPTRDGTCVLCIARQILNHWTTKEVPIPDLSVLFERWSLQSQKQLISAPALW